MRFRLRVTAGATNLSKNQHRLLPHIAAFCQEDLEQRASFKGLYQKRLQTAKNEISDEHRRTGPQVHSQEVAGDAVLPLISHG